MSGDKFIDWIAEHPVVAVGALLAIVALIVGFQAHQEAATYRRLTGRPVTTWDALWVELRVMDCASRGSVPTGEKP